jgi:phenylalanyl-tRNA synthetase beta chain
MEVVIPTFRPDVEREIDLIEEVARLYGYNNIPVTMPISGVQESTEADRMMGIRDKAKNILVACGLTEAINYSFHSPEAFDMLLMEEDSRYRNALKIRNPISESQSIMRTTLIPGLLANIKHNLNMRVSDIQIFEMGRVFHSKEQNKQPHEPEYVCGVITGLAGAQLWNDPTRPVDFFDIKGVVETFLYEMGARDYRFSPASNIFFQGDHQAEVISGDEVLGFLGEIHRKVLENHDIEQDIYMFELDFSKLVECTISQIQFQPLPVFPSVYRDMALVVAFDVPSSQIEETIKLAGGELIKTVNLFDVYKGKQIPANMRSLAYSIEYYSTDRTLTDEEVDQIHEKIIAVLDKKFGAELRK